MYPGDTNTDSLVNYLDILPIGLAFGDTGPARSGGSTGFNAQSTAVWELSLPNSGRNLLHIDADGNGQIGMGDAAVVANNYGASINPLVATPPTGVDRSSVPQLYVKADTVQGGQTSVIEVYLEEGDNDLEVYGLGFTVAYNAEQIVPGSFDVDFSESFFAGDGATLITLDREVTAASQWHIALTRRNKNNLAGRGLVARISFQPVAVAPGAIVDLPLTIDGIQLLNADEFSTSVAGQTTVLGVEGTTAVREPQWAQELTLYPNPVSGGTLLQIAAPAGAIQRMQLFDARGRLVLQQAYTPALDLSKLPRGSYLLRLFGVEGAITREVIKQ
jgi:hypothetical protein